MKLTQKRLKQVIGYNSLTGSFVWLMPPKTHPSLRFKPAGSIAQSHSGKNYLTIQIDGIKYRAHRLAWLYVHGKNPNVIDHINGDPLDNRILNLRDATHTQNAQNHKKEVGKSGLPVGVRLVKSGRFQSRITANGKVHYLGTFDTINDASFAYQQARCRLHDAPEVTL